MGSLLVIALILLALGLWLGWALARIHRRKKQGGGCAGCSSHCPYHDQCH